MVSKCCCEHPCMPKLPSGKPFLSIGTKNGLITDPDCGFSPENNDILTLTMNSPGNFSGGICFSVRCETTPSPPPGGDDKAV